MPDLSIRNAAQNIDRVIRHAIVDEGKKRFVIYTNGTGGRMVKEYLKSEFGICPEYVIDNKKYDGKTILNIEEAKKRNNKGIYFLISSWHNDCYNEIRNIIYKAFSEEQIIDVFSSKEKKILPTQEEICRVLYLIDNDIRAVEEKACL